MEDQEFNLGDIVIYKTFENKDFKMVVVIINDEEIICRWWSIQKQEFDKDTFIKEELVLWE